MAEADAATPPGSPSGPTPDPTPDPAAGAAAPTTEPAPAPGSVELNPAQRELLDVLGAGRGERPTFDPQLRRTLRHQLETSLSPLVPGLDALGIDQLWLSKYTVSSALGCEVRFLDEVERPFDGWTVPRARGTVAHRAIEAGLHVRGEPVPAEWVDHAIARLSEGESSSLGEWIQGLSELEVADLRAAATDLVSAFVETWPPLKLRWRPVAESRLRVELCGERFVLSGKVDLTVGVARGEVAGKVLIDLKTGGFAPSHLDDLRFYAVLETIRVGVPPRRLASHYLDSARLVPEDVTEAMLASAVGRIAAAATAVVELRAGRRPPELRTGPPCRWCPLRADCEPGTAYVEATTDL